MNKYLIYTAVLLSSSVFLTDSVIAMQSSLLTTDDGVDLLKKVGKPKFIEERSKNKAEKKRLSNKGDLQNNIDGIARRRFFTIGDGNCFFWGTDLTRARAQELWLQNSGNVRSRVLAAAEIYDEFMDNKLPEVMFTGLPLLRSYRERMNDFNGLLRTLSPSEHVVRREINRHKTELENEIRSHCHTEDVYRSYVQHALGRNEDYMLSPQDLGGSYRTYFIDALADILRAKLIIWNLNEQGTLIRSHTYDPGNTRLTWELLLDGEHYTRLVPVNNQVALNEALAKENVYLSQLTLTFNRKTKQKISNVVELLSLDTNERMASSPLFTATEQAECRKTAASLKQKLGTVKPLDDKMKAAFFKAMLTVAVEQIAKKSTEALRNEDKRVVLEQEVEGLREKVHFYREVLSQFKVKPKDREVVDALLHLYYSYAELAEAEEVKSVDIKLPEAERAAAKKAFDKYTGQKVIFRDACEEFEKALVCGSADLAVKVKEAQTRRNDRLNQKLRLENRWSFTADYNEARVVVNAHLNRLKATKKKYFNLDYLSADPFSQNVLPALSGAEISNAEWGNLTNQLRRSILTCLVSEKDRAVVSDCSDLPFELRANFPVLDLYTSKGTTKVSIVSESTFMTNTKGIFSNRSSLRETYNELSSILGRLEVYESSDSMPEQKKKGRKRFMRLINYKVAQSKSENGQQCGDFLAEAMGKVSGAMILQQIGGCPDGVMGSLDILESQMVGDTKSLETDVSAILAECAHEFVHKFARLESCQEWARNAPQFAKQRTMLSLPHQGDPRSNFYVLTGSVSAKADTLFAPANLMRIFLEGKVIQNIRFYPFTADTFISLVWGAYKRGLRKVKVGHIIKQEHIADFIRRDPWLNALHENYTYEGEYCDFFGANDKDGYIKKPFFDYMLTKLGYIIDPSQSWEKAKQNFEKSQAGNENDALVELGIINANGQPNIPPRLQFGRAALKKNAAIQGWATPIEIDFSARTLTVSGWSAVSGQGGAPRVSAFYKGNYIGTGGVDQDAHDIVAHFGSQGIAGDYSKSRFQTTLRLSNIDFRGFNSSELKIVGHDNQDGYNELAQTPVSVKGMLLNQSGLTIAGIPAVKVPKLEGSANTVKWDGVSQRLTLAGWAAIAGVGPASTIAVFYKGMCLGTAPVNQDSPSVVTLYKTKGQKVGNYSKCRFVATLNLEGSGYTNLNPPGIMVVGLDSRNGYNILPVKSRECTGSLTYVSEQMQIDNQPQVRKQTLSGWADSLTLDSKAKTLTVTGWSVVENNGGIPRVAVFYQGKNIGIISVNQSSQDISQHFLSEGQRRGQVIPGDYTHCRFSETLDVSSVDLVDFNENLLQVIGLDHTNAYNLLSKVSVKHK